MEKSVEKRLAHDVVKVEVRPVALQQTIAHEL
jgi:hypothetical protein